MGNFSGLGDLQTRNPSSVCAHVYTHVCSCACEGQRATLSALSAIPHLSLCSPGAASGFIPHPQDSLFSKGILSMGDVGRDKGRVQLILCCNGRYKTGEVSLRKQCVCVCVCVCMCVCMYE